MFFPKFVYLTKNTPFFPILHVFVPLNDVRAYSAWSWKTTLITWIFGRAWYPLDIRVAPPRAQTLIIVHYFQQYISGIHSILFFYSPTDAKNGRPQFKRKFHESWFITEPRAFGASHLPFTQPVTIDNVDIESQHSRTPYITCQEWNEEPQKYPEFFSSSMECISHTSSGKIESKNNEVEVKVKVRYPMEIFTTLVAVSNGTEKELPRNKYTVHFFQDNVVVVKVRLPKRGQYALTICGTPYGVGEEIKGSLNFPLVTYQIIETGEESLAPFPQVSGGLGPSWKFKLHGFSTSTKTPFLEAKNGKVDIEVKCRNGIKIKPMSSSFTQHGDVNGGEKLDNFIYGERCTDNRVVYHIRCPKIGTYVFKIYVKYGDNDRDSGKYEQGSSFQISCSGAPTKEKFPNENSSLWGPNDTMSKFGISTSK